MSASPIHSVAVIGAGLMGHGIAQEFAVASLDTRLVDRSDELLAQAIANMRRNLAMLAGAGLVTADDAERAPNAVRTTTDLASAVAGVDVVIEAVSEDLAVKHAVFRELDAAAPPHAIFASNSSSFMPSQLASATNRPERVLVAHYFNPPYLLPLVEVVRGPETADDAVQAIHALLQRIGKQPVIVQKEAMGFIANRMQVALSREALSIVERGIASPEDVDTVVKASFGRRLSFAGPFEIADIAGLDVIAAVEALLVPEIESSTTPSRLLHEIADRGDHGIKTGQGFYDWSPETADALRRRIAEGLIALMRADVPPRPQ